MEVNSFNRCGAFGKNESSNKVVLTVIKSFQIFLFIYMYSRDITFEIGNMKNKRRTRIEDLSFLIQRID